MGVLETKIYFCRWLHVLYFWPIVFKSFCRIFFTILLRKFNLDVYSYKDKFCFKNIKLNGIAPSPFSLSSGMYTTGMDDCTHLFYRCLPVFKDDQRAILNDMWVQLAAFFLTREECVIRRCRTFRKCCFPKSEK